MGCYGTNLTRARKQAFANAKTFGVAYYVVLTSAGLYVQREAPANPDFLVCTALPPPDGGSQLDHTGLGK